jgi:hypothetical protein
MRIVIMHKTSSYWESGGLPSQALIERVGALVGDLSAAGLLLGAEGLRPSSEGVRLKFSGRESTVSSGPFAGEHELPAGFSIVRAPSLDIAAAWAMREAAIVGDAEIDIRPVTEAWDIGLAPKPAEQMVRRYMVLRKATPETEADAPLSARQRAELSRLIEETTRSGVHLATETLRSSRRGRRYKNSRNGVSVFDGPFVESKELLAGYIVIAAASLDDADRWARRYIDVVEADEVDVRVGGSFDEAG